MKTLINILLILYAIIAVSSFAFTILGIYWGIMLHFSTLILYSSLTLLTIIFFSVLIYKHFKQYKNEKII